MTTQTFKSNDLVIVDAGEISVGCILRKTETGYLVHPGTGYPNGDNAVEYTADQLTMLKPAEENTFQPFTREDWYGYAGAEGDALILHAVKDSVKQVFWSAMEDRSHECAEVLGQELEVDFIIDDNGLCINACDENGNVFHGYLTESGKIAKILQSGIETAIKNDEFKHIADFGINFNFN